MRILAVDDDPIILDLLKNSLSSSGMAELTCAESAEDAIALVEAAEIPFDTFLLDIMLPGSNGITLCGRLRAMRAYRMTPIIMITAQRQPALMEQAFAAGATDFVRKPFDGLELGTRVHLAGMLNDAILREQDSAHSLAELTKLVNITFDERFALRNVDGMLDFLELENHLLRCTGGLMALQLFSVEANAARGRFRAVPASAFRYQMEQVGAAIAECVDTGKTRIAYGGRGTFVGVTHGRRRLDLVAMTHDVQAVLASSWEPLVAGTQDAPELSIGALTDQRLWSGVSASDALGAFLSRRGQSALDTSDSMFDALEERLKTAGL